MAKVINFPMNQNPPILMADISAYNANRNDPNNIIHFNFDKFQEKGGQVLCIRAQVANAGYDYEWHYNLQQVNERGIYFFIYDYVKLWHSIPSQVAGFVERLNECKNSPYFLGAWADIEANDGLNKTAFTGNAEKFVMNVKEDSGVNIGIYSRAGFWDSNTYVADWMKKLDWWIAHYFTGANPFTVPSYRPYLPECIASINNPIICKWWQFDTYNNGAEWGSTGDDEIDMNWFTWNGGTYSAFKELYGVELVHVEPPPPPEPPPSEENTMEWYVKPETKPYLNVRKTPGGTKVGSYDPNTKFKVKNIVYAYTGVWAQISEGQYVDQWTCLENSGGRYCEPVGM